MIPFANAARIVGASDNYSKWLAYANAIGATNLATPDTANGENKGWGLWRFTFSDPPAGVMYGTPHGPVGLGAFTADSMFTRIAQHTFLDDAARVSNQGRLVLLSVRDWGSTVGGFSSLTRNGYASLAYGGVFAAGWSDRFEYFNPVTGRRVVRNPYSNTTDEFDL